MIESMNQYYIFAKDEVEKNDKGPVHTTSYIAVRHYMQEEDSICGRTPTQLGKNLITERYKTTGDLHFHICTESKHIPDNSYVEISSAGSGVSAVNFRVLNRQETNQFLEGLVMEHSE